MTKIYTIKLSANLTHRNIFHIAYWNGWRFSTSGEPWASLNDEVKAQAEFEEVVKPLKPEYWQGCYKIELIVEEWNGNELINSGVLLEYKTSEYEEKRGN